MRLSIMAVAAGLALAGCGNSPPPPTEPGPVTDEDIAAVNRAVGDAPAPASEPEVTNSVSSTGMPTMTKRMSFAECLQTIRGMATDLGVAPTNIVETSELRIVRFNTSDGSVLVTCSAADGKLVAVQSPHQG